MNQEQPRQMFKESVSFSKYICFDDILTQTITKIIKIRSNLNYTYLHLYLM